MYLYYLFTLIACLPPLDSLASATRAVVFYSFIHRGIISLGYNAWLPVGTQSFVEQKKCLFSVPFPTHDIHDRQIFSHTLTVIN